MVDLGLSKTHRSETQLVGYLSRAGTNKGFRVMPKLADQSITDITTFSIYRC